MSNDSEELISNHTLTNTQKKQNGIQVTSTTEFSAHAKIKKEHSIKTCAIFILLSPNQTSLENIQQIMNQVDLVIVVDTSTTDEPGVEVTRNLIKDAGVYFLKNEPHAGEATALNIALKFAIQQKMDWAIFFDQYSAISQNYISSMKELVNENSDVGLILPTFADPRMNQPAGINEGQPLRDSSVFKTFTSGTMVKTSIVREIGLFDERLYADYVAHDFYCRVRDRKIKVVHAEHALLSHNHPDCRRLWGSSFRFITDRKLRFRSYYAFRNRMVMYRRNIFRAPGWVATDILASIGEVTHVIFNDEFKIRTLKHMLLGVIDGILGRMGPVELIPGVTDKSTGYYSSVRAEIFPLLPDHSEKLLDLGCGAGETAAAIKARGQADWIGGIEIMPDAVEKAKERLNLVVSGNIEAMDIGIEPESIDTILALDVLEHLVDPWLVVRKLDRMLKPGGVIIASIPNVRHLSALLPLLMMGDWRYQDSGILDSTHLRFFTRKTAIQLMISSGLKLEDVRTTGAGSRLGSFTSLFNILTLRKFQGFFDFQYLIKVKKI